MFVWFQNRKAYILINFTRLHVIWFWHWFCPNKSKIKVGIRLKFQSSKYYEQVIFIWFTIFHFIYYLSYFSYFKFQQLQCRCSFLIIVLHSHWVSLGVVNNMWHLSALLPTNTIRNVRIDKLFDLFTDLISDKYVIVDRWHF